MTINNIIKNLNNDYIPKNEPIKSLAVMNGVMTIILKNGDIITFEMN